MSSRRKFYRTVLQFEMLTEEPPRSVDLEDVHYEITEGHASGRLLQATEKVVDGPTMARLLVEQGSDPEFFCLTPDGEDTEEL